MVLKLLVALPFMLQAIPPNSALSAPPPINMGLWEASITTGMGTKLKTQACLTAQSYQQQLAQIPQGCTFKNVVRSRTSISADVSCELPNGISSSGHFDAQFPNASTAHTTINITTTLEGHTMPMTITSDSRLVSASCGDLGPGESRVIK